MSNENSTHFTGQQLLSLRREIKEQGFMVDEFLAKDPDCPVFGLNLACAYPFPKTVEDSYTAMAARLAALDEGAYVYPIWETHVTMVTFLNFSLQRRPSPERLDELRSWIGPTIALIQSLFDTEAIGSFQLEFQPPVLTRKTAILPVADTSGQITRIRSRARQLLEGNKGLREKFSGNGLNVPGIVHSTIMRLQKAPRDAARFAAGFDAVAAATTPFAITVREILLTTETRPYMRQGEVVHRFPLAAAQQAI